MVWMWPVRNSAFPNFLEFGFPGGPGIGVLEISPDPPRLRCGQEEEEEPEGSLVALEA